MRPSTKVTRHVPSLVTQEKNSALLRPITIEEVDQALQDTPKCKAPGPDGFTSDFFHHCWPMIRVQRFGKFLKTPEPLDKSSRLSMPLSSP
jgi:hypothetical protein